MQGKISGCAGREMTAEGATLREVMTSNLIAVTLWPGTARMRQRKYVS
jgi:hypothetical protein